VQVQLAQDHRAGLTQLRDLERIFAGNDTSECKRTTRGRDVPRIEIVLEQHRDPVHWTAWALSPSLGVERTSIDGRVRVEVEHGVQTWTGLIVRRDAGQVEFHELGRGEAALSHRRLKFGDALLDDVVGGSSLRDEHLPAAGAHRHERGSRIQERSPRQEFHGRNVRSLHRRFLMHRAWRSRRRRQGSGRLHRGRALGRLAHAPACHR
jgi:hypothetical protein